MFTKFIEWLTLFGNPLWPTEKQIEQCAEQAQVLIHEQTAILSYQLFVAYGCTDEQYNWFVAERLLGL